MTISPSVNQAMESAFLSLIATVEIMDAAGRVLVAVPYPELEGKATETGKAATWRILDDKGDSIRSDKIGKGLTLDRLDIQWGSVVTIDKIEIEVT